MARSFGGGYDHCDLRRHFFAVGSVIRKSNSFRHGSDHRLVCFADFRLAKFRDFKTYILQKHKLVRAFIGQALACIGSSPAHNCQTFQQSWYVAGNYSVDRRLPD